MPLNNTRCWGGIIAQRRSYGNTLRVNFEIINPTTWTYIALGSIYLQGPGTGRWEPVGVGVFRPPVGAFYLRISVIGVNGYTAMANFDNFTFTCEFTR